MQLYAPAYGQTHWYGQTYGQTIGKPIGKPMGKPSFAMKMRLYGDVIKVLDSASVSLFKTCMHQNIPQGWFAHGFAHRFAHRLPICLPIPNGFAHMQARAVACKARALTLSFCSHPQRHPEPSQELVAEISFHGVPRRMSKKIIEMLQNAKKGLREQKKQLRKSAL